MRRVLSLLIAGVLVIGVTSVWAESVGGKGRASAAVKRDESKPAAENSKLDLNVATVDELSTLPGIGPKRARAIVAYRERHRFARTRELRRIRGIGAKTFQRLQAHVTVTSGPGARGFAPASSGSSLRAQARR